MKYFHLHVIYSCRVKSGIKSVYATAFAGRFLSDTICHKKLRMHLHHPQSCYVAVSQDTLSLR